MTAESMRDLLRGVAIAALAGAVMALRGAFTGPGLPLEAMKKASCMTLGISSTVFTR